MRCVCKRRLFQVTFYDTRATRADSKSPTIRPNFQAKIVSPLNNLSLLTCKSSLMRTTRCKVPLEWNASARTESFSDLPYAQLSRAPIPLGISEYQQRSARGSKCNVRSLSLKSQEQTTTTVGKCYKF